MSITKKMATIMFFACMEFRYLNYIQFESSFWGEDGGVAPVLKLDRRQGSVTNAKTSVCVCGGRSTLTHCVWVRLVFVDGAVAKRGLTFIIVFNFKLSTLNDFTPTSTPQRPFRSWVTIFPLSPL